VKPDAVINAEIAALVALRTQIPPVSFFGDDNLAHLDAQAQTLRMRYTTDEQLAAAFLPYDEEEGDIGTQQDFDNESSAREAMYWMLDEDTHPNPPSADWQSLVS
jgi:hypothetical protein